MHYFSRMIFSLLFFSVICSPICAAPLITDPGTIFSVPPIIDLPYLTPVTDPVFGTKSFVLPMIPASQRHLLMASGVVMHAITIQNISPGIRMVPYWCCKIKKVVAHRNSFIWMAIPISRNSVSAAIMDWETIAGILVSNIPMNGSM